MKPKSADLASEPRVDTGFEADGSVRTRKQQLAFARMQSAASKLAELLSGDAIDTSELNQRALHAIVVDLFEIAMASGVVGFKEAACFVLSRVAQTVGKTAAEIVHIELLQGIYIAVSARFKEQGVTPKAEVLEYDSLADLVTDEDDWETEELAELEAEYQKWARPFSRCHQNLGSPPRETEPPSQDVSSAAATDARLGRFT
jgi:hypothetical protein